MLPANRSIRPKNCITNKRLRPAGNSSGRMFFAKFFLLLKKHLTKPRFYWYNNEAVLRPVGQAAKTPPFHGGNGSSILPRVISGRQYHVVLLFYSSLYCIRNSPGYLPMCFSLTRSYLAASRMKPVYRTVVWIYKNILTNPLCCGIIHIS